MNIYEKIATIMQDVQYLAKDGHVEYGTTKYKALSEEKVTAIMRAEMLKHGLVVYPVMQTYSRTGNITHVDVMYRMVNVEAPEEYIEIASCGDGADTQDKGSGKAMTYAFKYMWLRTFALPTGEDPDKIASAELDDKERNAAPVCDRCGSEITESTKKSGATWAVKDIVKYAKAHYGAPLCVACMRDVKAERNAM